MVSEALIQSLFVLPVSEHVQNVISQIRSGFVMAGSRVGWYRPIDIVWTSL